MRKALVLIMAIAMMAASTGCGESAKTSSNGGEKKENSSVEDVSSESKESEGLVLKAVTESKKPTTYGLDGVSFTFPEGFNMDSIDVFLSWSGKQKTDDDIYLMIAKDTMKDYPADLTLDDAIVEMEEWIYDAVYEKFGTYRDTYKNTVEKTEEVEIDGVKYQKKIGSIHADNEKTVTELKYIAYFSLYNFPKIERTNIPMIMMTLSEAKDTDTVDEMSKIVDNTVNNLCEYKYE